MSTVGVGYGSGWHLLRYLGDHRADLDRSVESAIAGGTVVGWLAPGCGTHPAPIDRVPPRPPGREIEGFEFLPAPRRQQLIPSWPRTGSLPCRDAVARIKVDGEDGWLIVEAKSHLGELRSTCKAKGGDVGGGRDRIIGAFRATQQSPGITRGSDAWLGPYYQFGNSLAFLNLFADEGIPVHLLLLYFLGDRFPRGRGASCPGTEAGWQAALAVMEQHVGRQPGNPLFGRVHKLFLPACPPHPTPDPTADLPARGRGTS